MPFISSHNINKIRFHELIVSMCDFAKAMTGVTAGTIANINAK